VFQVQHQHRGVLVAVSATPDFFSPQDLRFLEAVGRWIGIVVDRAELVERMRQEAVEQGRRLAAEELLTIMATTCATISRRSKDASSCSRDERSGKDASRSCAMLGRWSTRWACWGG
jgi:hypothetical protein